MMVARPTLVAELELQVGGHNDSIKMGETKLGHNVVLDFLDEPSIHYMDDSGFDVGLENNDGK